MSLMLSKLKDVSRTSEQQEGKEEESLGSLPSIASLVGIRSVAVSSSSEINTGQKQDRVAALAAQVDSLVSNMEDASQQIQAKDSIIQEQKLQIEEMHVIVKNLQATVQPLLSDLKDCQQEVIATGSRTTSFEQKQIAAHSKVAAMEHRLVAIEKNLTMKDNALAEHDVRLLSLEMTSYDGVLRWKITEFVRRRSEAIAGRRLSIYSPPFFTSRNGYKMCARIYLNGDGMGKGSHLSLFFVIMKGEFDALLPWPFQQRVTFTLIDQEHRRHVSDTFQPDPSSSSFQRPTTDMNVASGCPLFVPLEALETRGYVKDDTMFIRVAVEIKGLIHP
jgi:TNF receptor-associated factor 3